MKVMVAGLQVEEATQLMESVRVPVPPEKIIPIWENLETNIGDDRPDVLVIYLGNRPSHALAMVRRLLALYPTMQVIALAPESAPELVKMVSAAGCVDMALLSQSPHDLRRALQSLNKHGHSGSVTGEAIALLGAKGGVGTTTIACNLADALATARPDERVIVVDVNFYMGDVSLVLDISPSPGTLYFLKRAAHADSQTWLERPPKHRRGFRVMCLDGDLEAADQISAEQVVFLVERLKTWYHHIIIDCGNDVNEASMAACSSADQRILVTTEQLGSRLGARRRISALRVLNPEKRQLVAIVNRYHGDKKLLRALEQTIHIPIIHTLPNAWQESNDALARGQTLLESAPRSALTAEISQLAGKVAGKSQEEDRRKKVFFNFFR